MRSTLSWAALCRPLIHYLSNEFIMFDQITGRKAKFTERYSISKFNLNDIQIYSAFWMGFLPPFFSSSEPVIRFNTNPSSHCSWPQEVLLNSIQTVASFRFAFRPCFISGIDWYHEGPIEGDGKWNTCAEGYYSFGKVHSHVIVLIAARTARS